MHDEPYSNTGIPDLHRKKAGKAPLKAAPQEIETSPEGNLMRKRDIFTDGSPWPASIASRLSLHLKCQKSHKEPTDLRFGVRVLEIDAEDSHNPKGFSAYFSDKPVDYICFDIGRGEVLQSWIELPGPKEKDGNCKVVRRYFSRDISTKNHVFEEEPPFNKMVWLGETTAGNCTWKRVKSPVSLTLLVGLKVGWKAVKSGTMPVPPGVAEIAAVLGIAVSYIVERRARVLFGDSSSNRWFLVDMPQVVYFILDSVLCDEHSRSVHHSRPEDGVSVADAVAST